MCNRNKRGSRRDGFILIATLVVLALLSGLVATLSLGLRSGIDNAALATDALIADALMQAGTEMAGYQLFALKRPRDAIDGEEIRLDGGAVTVFVRSEAGKVDLNGSDAALLAAAYRAAGLVGTFELSPEGFAARVEDWRDVDDEEGEGGAEAPTYAMAGVGFAPRNGAFHSVDDLRWVLGLQARDISALRPFLTTYNPAGLLDVLEAPPALIRNLPGLSRARIEAVLKARRAAGAPQLSTYQSFFGGHLEFFAAEPIPIYEIRLVVRINRSSLSRDVRLVMIGSEDRSSPYRVVAWRSER